LLTRERALARAAMYRDAIKGFFASIETRRMLLRAAGRALLGIWLIWLNPFDLFHKADEASSNAFQFFMTPLIPHDHKPPPITVVLFTPSGLDAVRAALEEDDSWAWPLTFDQQAQVLNRILAYKPAAVFYDIEFYQPRGSADSFRAALLQATGAAMPWDCLNDRSTAKIPVFLAQPPAPQAIREQLCTAGTQAVNVNWKARPNVYPLVQATGDAKAQQLLSPAAALFVSACWNRAVVMDRSKCFFKSPQDVAARDPINIVWRSDYETSAGNPDALNLTTLILPECDYAGGLEPGGWWVFSNGASSAAENTITTCPAPAVVSVDRLLLYPAVLKHPKHPELDNAGLSAALTGKIVIIGADFPGLRDRVATPFHGMVPGAFAHAAALENLIENGENYIRASTDERSFFPGRTLQFFIVWLALFATMAATARIEERAPQLPAIVRNGPQWPDARRALGIFAALLATAFFTLGGLFAISSFYFLVLREAPLNWIGEIALVWLFAFDEIIKLAGRASAVFLLFAPPARFLARYFLKDPKEEHSHA